jgi:hypothetical protein
LVSNWRAGGAEVLARVVEFRASLQLSCKLPVEFDVTSSELPKASSADSD